MSLAQAFIIGALLGMSTLFVSPSRWTDRAASADRAQAALFADAGEPDDEPSNVLVDLEDDDVLLPAVPMSLSSPISVTAAATDFSELQLTRDPAGRLFRPPRTMAS
jgi:hypothetical protein